jgi:hypothetical protein
VVKCDLNTYETEDAALSTRPLPSVFLLGMPRSLKQAYAQLAVDTTHLETLKTEAQLPRHSDDFYDDDGDEENHESLDGWTDVLSYATAPPCDIDHEELDPFKSPKLRNMSLCNTLLSTCSGLFDNVKDFTCRLKWGADRSTWSANEMMETLCYLTNLEILSPEWRIKQATTWRPD